MFTIGLARNPAFPCLEIDLRMSKTRALPDREALISPRSLRRDKSGAVLPERRRSPRPRLPRASLRSVLLICAFNTAFMCRVSTRITGKPASARALKSHCDSGPFVGLVFPQLVLEQSGGRKSLSGKVPAVHLRCWCGDRHLLRFHRRSWERAVGSSPMEDHRLSAMVGLELGLAGGEEFHLSSPGNKPELAADDREVQFVS
jgi:hypothetical protein